MLDWLQRLASNLNLVLFLPRFTKIFIALSVSLHTLHRRFEDAWFFLWRLTVRESHRLVPAFKHDLRVLSDFAARVGNLLSQLFVAVDLGHVFVDSILGLDELL